MDFLHVLLLRGEEFEFDDDDKLENLLMFEHLMTLSLQEQEALTVTIV